MWSRIHSEVILWCGVALAQPWEGLSLLPCAALVLSLEVFWAILSYCSVDSSLGTDHWSFWSQCQSRLGPLALLCELFPYKLQPRLLTSTTWCTTVLRLCHGSRCETSWQYWAFLSRNIKYTSIYLIPWSPQVFKIFLCVYFDILLDLHLRILCLGLMVLWFFTFKF